jgi:hypothetical protein
LYKKRLNGQKDREIFGFYFIHISLYTAFLSIAKTTEELYFIKSFIPINLLLEKNAIMGRVFTVSFRFMEHPCTAFNVHYLTKEVETIIPERKIVFTLANGIECPENLHDKLAEELVEHTSEAISHYLEIH